MSAPPEARPGAAREAEPERSAALLSVRERRQLGLLLARSVVALITLVGA